MMLNIFYKCFLAILVSYIENYLFRSVPSFKWNYLVCGCLVSWILCVFWILDLYWTWSWWKNWAPFCRLLLYIIDGVLCLKEAFSFMGSHLLIAHVSALLLVFCLVSFLLCQCIQDFSLLSLLSIARCACIYIEVWSVWICILCRIIDINLFAFFYMQTSS